MGVEVPIVKAPIKKYGKVVITLNNVLIPNEKLSTSPSQLDSLDPEIEVQLRISGCELIQISGILLKLPQVAMATGQIIFNRFYCATSMVTYPMEITAMACIALASKIEEAPRKFRDVINVFRHIKQVKTGRIIQPVILDRDYTFLKNQIIKAERRLLKELGFCCHVKHPHKFILIYLRFLDAENHKKLAQLSWNYMNDSLRTDVFMKFSPETVACGCIWLAGRQLKYPLPENPPWYLVFNIALTDIHQIAASILKLYIRKKTKLADLETQVERIRREQKEAKKLISLATPREITTFSPASKNSSPKIQNSKNHKRSSSSRGNTQSGSNEDYSRSPSPRGRKRNKKSHKQRVNKRYGSHEDYSRSPTPRNKKRNKKSHKQSRSRSRSHSRDRYYKKYKKYSRSPSPAVTPPPKFNKKKERAIPPSISRSRLTSKSANCHNHNYEEYHHYDSYTRSEKYERTGVYERLSNGAKMNTRRNRY